MKVQRRYSICFTYAKRKPPHGAATPKGGLLFSAYGPRTIRQATCRCNARSHLLRRTAREFRNSAFISPPSHLKWADEAARQVYHIFRPKDTAKFPRIFPAADSVVLTTLLSILFLPLCAFVITMG